MAEAFEKFLVHLAAGSPLFDTPRLTREMEAAFEAMLAAAVKR